MPTNLSNVIVVSSKTNQISGVKVTNNNVSTFPVKVISENKVTNTGSVSPALTAVPVVVRPGGASAYQLALSNGFVGSQKDWLISLIGKDGEDGLTGLTGLPGPTGSIGAQGNQGTSGPQGLQGIPGVTDIPSDLLAHYILAT